VIASPTFLSLAQELAVASADIYEQRAKLGSIEFVTKDDDSPVTELDVELDRKLREIIRAHYPEDRIISEEGDNAAGSHSAENAIWWIDPIDGTKEFIKGGKDWIVQLARSIKGTLEESILISPGNNIFYYAKKNQGAWAAALPILPALTQFRSVKISKAPPTLPIAIGSASRADVRESTFLEAMKVNTLLQRSSLGLKAAAIAEGEAHLYPNFSGLSHLWDLAAPQLFLEEAGGLVIFQSGSAQYSGLGPTVISQSYVLANSMMRESVLQHWPDV